MYIFNKDFGVKQGVSNGGELKTPRSFQGPKEISAGNVHLFQEEPQPRYKYPLCEKICMYVYIYILFIVYTQIL